MPWRIFTTCGRVGRAPPPSHSRPRRRAHLGWTVSSCTQTAALGARITPLADTSSPLVLSCHSGRVIPTGSHHGPHDAIARSRSSRKLESVPHGHGARRTAIGLPGLFIYLGTKKQKNKFSTSRSQAGRPRTAGPVPGGAPEERHYPATRRPSQKARLLGPRPPGRQTRSLSPPQLLTPKMTVNKTVSGSAPGRAHGPGAAPASCRRLSFTPSTHQGTGTQEPPHPEKEAEVRRAPGTCELVPRAPAHGQWRLLWEGAGDSERPR